MSYPQIQQYIGPSTPVDGVSQGFIAIDSGANNRLFFLSEGSTSVCGYREFDITSGSQTSQAAIGTIYGAVSPYSIRYPSLLGYDGQILAIRQSFGNDGSTLALIDPSDWTVSATYNPTNGLTLPTETPHSMAPVSENGYDFALLGTGLPYGDSIYVMEAHGSTLSFAGHLFTPDETQHSVGPTIPETGIAYTIGRGPNTASTVPLGLYKTTISSGAHGYNTASWPGSPNSHIATTKIGTISPAQVDATWSHFTGSSPPGYDQSDGNIILSVVTSDAVTTKNYIIKINAATAAVMWKCAVTGLGNTAASFNAANIKNGNLAHGFGGKLYRINTATGAATTTDLTNTTILSSIYDDDSNSLYCYGSYGGGVAPPDPVTGTSAFGANWFRLILGPSVIPPPLAGGAKWFAVCKPLQRLSA